MYETFEIVILELVTSNLFSVFGQVYIFQIYSDKSVFNRILNSVN